MVIRLSSSFINCDELILFPKTQSCAYNSHNFCYMHMLQWGLPGWLNGKESACQCSRCGFDPWVGKIPWRWKWQPTPIFLLGKSQGQRSLAGYSPWGSKESDMTKRLTLSLHFTVAWGTLVPWPGIDPGLLALQGGFLTTGLLGSPSLNS